MSLRSAASGAPSLWVTKEASGSVGLRTPGPSHQNPALFNSHLRPACHAGAAGLVTRAMKESTSVSRSQSPPDWRLGGETAATGGRAAGALCAHTFWGRGGAHPLLPGVPIPHTKLPLASRSENTAKPFSLLGPTRPCHASCLCTRCSLLWMLFPPRSLHERGPVTDEILGEAVPNPLGQSRPHCR